MRILGLVLVTSLAVGYLAHTPARAAECDATTVGTASRATDLPIYYGGTLAPVVIEAERQPTVSARIVAQPATSAHPSAVLN